MYHTPNFNAIERSAADWILNNVRAHVNLGALRHREFNNWKWVVTILREPKISSFYSIGRSTAAELLIIH